MMPSDPAEAADPEECAPCPRCRPTERRAVRAAIKASEAHLNGKGRLLVRKSGAEPLIRVMAEGDRKLVVGVVDDICSAVTAVSSP